MSICKNCNEAVQDEHFYCHACGAKRIHERLSIRSVVHEITDKFFNYDSALFKTWRHLFQTPEKVIISYIEGVRKRYVNPISYVAISLTLSGISILIQRKFFPNSLEYGTFYNEQQNAIQEKIGSMVQDAHSLIFLFMIPIFGMISWLIFVKRGYNLAEHIVLQTYTNAQFSITSFMLGIPFMVLFKGNYYMNFSFSMIFLLFVYNCYVYKKVFQLSAKQLVLKILLFIPIISFLYLAFSIALFVGLMMLGYINPAEFAPQP